MLSEADHDYTFRCLAHEWPEVLADAWTDRRGNEWVCVKIPSSCEFRFRASLLRAALGQAG